MLLEKPGVLTAAQTGTLIETAKEHRVVYLEAMRLVFDDALPIIRDALPEIGTLRRVTAEFTQYSSAMTAYAPGSRASTPLTQALQRGDFGHGLLSHPRARVDVRRADARVGGGVSSGKRV